MTMGGRLTREDLAARLAARASPLEAPVRRPAAHTAPAGAPAPTGAPATAVEPGAQLVPLSARRRRIGANLRRSLDSAAHTLIVVEVDYHAVEPVRRARGLSYLPFVARAAIDALAQFPEVNATFRDDALVLHPAVHLGISVDLDFAGLVVPVVKHADDLRLTGLAEALRDVAARARARELGADELVGGTFTITNAGGYGTVVTAPIINPPQVAILSTDGVRMRPTAVSDGEGGWSLAIRPLGNLSLSFDHRAFDGAYAAAFASTVRDLLAGRDWEAEV